MLTKKQLFTRGMLDISPHMLSVIPFGIICGAIGVELGLKFAIPLTFIAIVVQDLKKLDHVIVMITCGLSSLLFFDAPFKSYIIISPIIALFVAALLLRLKK